jgi:hypothetical protein
MTHEKVSRQDEADLIVEWCKNGETGMGLCAKPDEGSFEEA